MAGKIGHNIDDNEIVHCFDYDNYFKNIYPIVNALTKAKSPTESKANVPAKANVPEKYNDLKQLVDDIKNGDVNDNTISLNTFKGSGAYGGADKNIQDCINLAGKIGHNLDDNEIVHCFDDANYFKNKYPNVKAPTEAKANIPESNETTNVPETNETANVPETNVTANVPESNVTANVPESNVTANVPESNVTANVPESNVTANVPESNVTANVPESNVTA